MPNNKNFKKIDNNKNKINKVKMKSYPKSNINKKQVYIYAAAAGGTI